MSEVRTEISSLGEFGLIDHLTKNFEIQNASTIVSVGDDAAVNRSFRKTNCYHNRFAHRRHSL
jgi:thiamine-monophosphate kinase